MIIRMNRFFGIAALVSVFAFGLMPHEVAAQKLKCKEKKSVKRLRKHIGYLASDELEGRSTGSEGELLSAQYLANQFDKLGLQPMGDDGSFLQEFSVVSLRLTMDQGNTFKLGKESLSLFQDYYPLSYSANNASVKGNIVNCGFGIEAAGRNDFVNELDGNIALIDISSPDGIHPHSKWAAYHGVQIRVDKAIEKGATGVIFYTKDQQIDEPSGELSLKMSPSKIPVVYVSRDTKIDLTGNVELSVAIVTDSEEGHNVLAFIDNGAKHTVVIGAHHDHLGRGEHGGSLSNEISQIHNGADDNASGSAGLIELARVLRKGKKGINSNNYLIAAFSGEEMGLLGSKYLVNHLPFQLEQTNYMLNMDMVGMLDSASKTLVINGIGSSSKWQETIGALNEQVPGISKVKTTSSGIGSSDHTSFYLKGVPSVHFFTGQHPHYHKPTDDVENLNYGGEVRVLNYMLAMVRHLDGQGKIDYQKTKNDDANKRRSFKVTLGIIPDYIYDGEGLRVDGVKEGQTGDKAGLKDGDIIVSLAGKSIKDIKDYMSMLSELNKGDLKKMQVRRNGEIVDLQVQF